MEKGSLGALARPLAALAVGLGALASAASTGCGPSFQAIYEGNSRFEHCYALEESAQTSMNEKADCWREWSERYTYGQTRDRIHYATARYVALSQAPSAPTDEAMMMAAPGMTPRQSTITAPTPTNPLAPPPKVLDEASAAAAQRASAESHGPVTGIGAVSSAPGASPGSTLPAAAAAAKAAPEAPPGPRLPAADCSTSCGRAFEGCSGKCAGAGAGSGDAGAGAGDAGAAACAACDKTYRACMRACFK